MKLPILAIGASILLTACASTTSGTVTPVTPTYADGTMTVTTPDVTTSANMQAATYDGATSTIISQIPVTFERTSDPNVIKLTVNGTLLTLTYDSVSDDYKDSNGNSFRVSATSPDGQAELTDVICATCVSGSTIVGIQSHGLETNPTQVAALASTPGTATYTIPRVSIALNSGIGGGNIGNGNGTGTLSADFNGGTVNGTVTFNGHTFGITNGAVLNMTGTISGNSFTGTVTAPTPTEFLMSSISSSTLAGKFYGVNAADAGGSFAGTGLLATDGSPVTFIGGFLATP